MDKQKNLIMIAVAAVILIAVNVGVLMASNSGAIAPVENIGLWGAFVVLNVASILWAISLMGLQPLVVAVSYIAGGALAFVGVRNAADVSVAEVVTAGATYGAFGALAIGNVTAKVRLAFFNKKQVPFIFIIVGLLVIDAGLNSGISSAGVNVILSAVALPFGVAGIGLGLVGGLVTKAIGGKAEAPVAVEVAAPKKAEKKVTKPAPVQAQKKPQPKKQAQKKPQPQKSAGKKKSNKKAKPSKPAPAKPAVDPVVVPEPVIAEKVAPVVVPEPEPVIEKTPEPVVAQAAPAKEKEDAFIPLEIDSDEAKLAASKEDEFVLPSFDASLYASGATEQAVETKEPELSVDLDSIAEILGESAPAAEAAPELEKVEQPAAEMPEEPQEGEAGDEPKGDWLGGHLDLLNKLK